MPYKKTGYGCKWTLLPGITLIILKRVWRYQRGNQKPYIEEEQTTQWHKENAQKDKQRSTKHTYKTKAKKQWFYWCYAFHSHIRVKGGYETKVTILTPWSIVPVTASIYILITFLLYSCELTFLSEKIRLLGTNKKKSKQISHCLNNYKI